VKRIAKNYLENDPKAKGWTHDIETLARRINEQTTRLNRLTTDVEKAQDTIDTNTAHITGIEGRLT
jgi:uncharacterized protein YoxC